MNDFAGAEQTAHFRLAHLLATAAICSHSSREEVGGEEGEEEEQEEAEDDSDRERPFSARFSISDMIIQLVGF